MSNALLVLYLPEERQALFVQGARPGVLPLAAGQQRQGEERPGGVLLEAHRSGERHSLLE